MTQSSDSARDLIADEIMAEARVAFSDAVQVWWNHGVPAGTALIARALMARDKRAAEIARRRIIGGYLHGGSEFMDGEAIATAILTYEPEAK